MTNPEATFTEVLPPQEYNSYVLKPEHVQGYLANFREGVAPGLDVHAPEMVAKLDMPLSELLERAGVAQTLPPSALQTELSVRDVFALGALESIDELPYADEDQEAAIRDTVEEHVPEIPLINGLAPADVARWLYEDPLDIPLSARSGRRLRIRDVLGTDEERHYSGRIAAFTSTGPVVDVTRPLAVAEGGDALTAAIEGVTHTLDGDKK